MLAKSLITTLEPIGVTLSSVCTLTVSLVQDMIVYLFKNVPVKFIQSTIESKSSYIIEKSKPD